MFQGYGNFVILIMPKFEKACLFLDVKEGDLYCNPCLPLGSHCL
jgi:hypothetical protein